MFKQEKVAEVEDWCVNAKVGCTECKKRLAEIMVDFLHPIKTKREELLQNEDYLNEILKQGEEKARAVAQQTIGEVRECLSLS